MHLNILFPPPSFFFSLVLSFLFFSHSFRPQAFLQLLGDRGHAVSRAVPGTRIRILAVRPEHDAMGGLRDGTQRAAPRYGDLLRARRLLLHPCRGILAGDSRGLPRHAFSFPSPRGLACRHQLRGCILSPPFNLGHTHKKKKKKKNSFEKVAQTIGFPISEVFGCCSCHTSVCRLPHQISSCNQQSSYTSPIQGKEPR